MTRRIRGPVRFDPGTRHVLAVCTECGPWRVLRASRPAALRAAAVHVAQVHEDADLAGHLRELAARQEEDPTRRPGGNGGRT